MSVVLLSLPIPYGFQRWFQMHGMWVNSRDVEELLKDAASKYRAERIKGCMIVQLFSACAVDVAVHTVNKILIQVLE